MFNDLSCAYLGDANLIGADKSDADLEYTNLTRPKNLTQPQVKEAENW
ncbi:MAG: pentapeptide repeat-containing protein [Stigonema ocellatum SAG 48.90 = DSM 106950]|nr:pentapeptide repeat-containing protein [Stigonema ocellatum SAG 48.90 = DSM 106950]